MSRLAEERRARLSAAPAPSADDVARARRQMLMPALGLTLLLAAFALWAHAQNRALERTVQASPRIPVTVTQRTAQGCALRLELPEGPRTARAPQCPPEDHAWARALPNGPAPWAFEPIPPFFSNNAFAGLALLCAGVWAASLTALRARIRALS